MKATVIPPDTVMELLRQALNVARGNQTALLICPDRQTWGACLNALVHSLTQEESHKVTFTQDALFYAERGSIRYYPSNHVEWDATAKTHRGYPAGQPTFVVEGAL